MKKKNCVPSHNLLNSCCRCELLPKGNKKLPQISEKALEMEVLAGDYLIEKGYHIIHSGGVVIWNSRLRKKFTGSRWRRWTKEQDKKFELVQAIWRKLSLHSYGYDYLCKKGNYYFVFEIKYKIWKKGRKQFNSSEKQIHEYNRVQKQGKVKVKVLTIIEKDKKLFYKISNWDDFEKTKVSIKPKFPELIFGKD